MAETHYSHRAMHYQHSPDAGESTAHQHDAHAGHSVAMFRDRFWISLLLSVPTLVWGHMLQSALGYRRRRFPGPRTARCVRHRRVLLRRHAVPAGAVRELRDRVPGMMTLISLAITVAFVFSLAVTLGYPGEALWWELSRS